MTSAGAGSVPIKVATTTCCSYFCGAASTFARTVIFSPRLSRSRRRAPSRGGRIECEFGPFAPPIPLQGMIRESKSGRGRVEGDDALGAFLEAGDAVHLARGARGHGDLALEVGVLEILGLAVADPDEVGRDVGRVRARGEHGPEVGIGGELLQNRFHFPDLPGDAVPALAAGKPDDRRIGEAVFLEPVEDVLGLEERFGVFGRLPVAGHPAQGDDVAEGGLARGFPGDEVHLDLGEERPLEPGSQLAARGGGDEDKNGSENGFHPTRHGRTPEAKSGTETRVLLPKPGVLANAGPGSGRAGGLTERSESVRIAIQCRIKRIFSARRS